MSEIISEAYQNKVVDGNLMVQNNLVVAGTLKAQEVKQPNMGLYPDIEALQAAIPSPEIGMWATVGDTVPGDIYRCDTAGVWSATGGTGGVDNTLYKGVAESIRKLSVTDEVLLLRMQGKDRDSENNPIPHDNTFDPFFFKQFTGGEQAYLDAREWLDSLHTTVDGSIPLGLLRLIINGAYVYVLQNVINYANDQHTQTILNGYVMPNGGIRPDVGIYTRSSQMVDGVTTWTGWGRIGELDSATVQSMINTSISTKADLVDGKVPANQLPAYVDEIREYPSFPEFPETGGDAKIYLALDTNKQYRWSGTRYSEVSPSLALGETAQTAFAGNRGKELETAQTSLTRRISTAEQNVVNINSAIQNLQAAAQALQMAVSGKENVVELTQYLDSTKTLPQHGVYVYNGNPVNHLRVIPINNGEEAELAFCVNHQEEPDTQYSELYILYAQTENGWVFVESWDKDDKNLPDYIVKAFGEDYASQADLTSLNNAINSLGRGLSDLAQSFNSRLDNGYYTKQETDRALDEKARVDDLSDEITRAGEAETELSNSIASLSNDVRVLPKFVTVEDYMPGGTEEGLFMPVGIYLYRMEPCEMRLRWSAADERYLLYLYYEDSFGAKVYLVFSGANSMSIYIGYEYVTQYNGNNVPQSVKELFGEYADATETAKGLMGVADKVKLNNIQQQVFDFAAITEDPTLLIPATTIEGITLLSGQNIYVYIESYEGRRELEVDELIGLQVVGSGKQVVRCINRDNLQPGISASVAVSAVIDGAVNFNKTLTISTDGRNVTGKIIIA